MVELNMTLIPVDFDVMDMGIKTSSPIILGRPFLRSIGAIIDSKEGNAKFQFPYKKYMEHLCRKKESTPKYNFTHDFHPS
jgi:hypothetical protein